MFIKDHNKGFTLVELAIVMVIIGLLIGGILKGSELIKTAQLNSLIKQISSYSAAANIYKDKYNALPGDDRLATIKVPHCNDASYFCLNGDGDGIIGATITNYSRANQNAQTALPGVETTMFWKHLLLSDLITGVQSNANPGNPVWGETHPFIKGFGGFAILYVQETGSDNPASGHYLMMRVPTTGDPHPTGPGDGALTPREALYIENKIDDGNSQTGSMRSDDAGRQCASNTGIYQENDDKVCLSIFAF